MSFQIELGKLPDYFAGVAVVWAIWTYRGERRRDREATEARYRAEKLERLREAAKVGARLALEDGQGGYDHLHGDLVARVWNSSMLSVQNVVFEAHHPVVGDWRYAWPTLNGAETATWSDARDAALFDPSLEDFSWTLRFTNSLGDSWMKSSQGEVRQLNNPLT